MGYFSFAVPILLGFQEALPLLQSFQISTRPIFLFLNYVFGSIYRRKILNRMANSNADSIALNVASIPSKTKLFLWTFSLPNVPTMSEERFSSCRLNWFRIEKIVLWQDWSYIVPLNLCLWFDIINTNVLNHSVSMVFFDSFNSPETPSIERMEFSETSPTWSKEMT